VALNRLRRYATGLVISLFLVPALSKPPATAALEPARPAKVRVLFIGNSYTFFNNLPQILTGLAESANQAVETEMIAAAGATLKKHWEEGKAVEALKRVPWDYVVLQEQSTLGLPSQPGAQINSPKMFHEYARLFNSEIGKVGAKTVFFLTWARQDRPHTQALLTDAYFSIAKELKAIVAPVGIAWQKAARKNAKVALHQKDLSHPTPAGSYLAACVLYSTLLRKSPVGLAAVVLGNAVDAGGRVASGQEAAGNGHTKVQLAMLSKSDALFLQRVARETVSAK
jgi:hypothetical protein